MSEQPFKNPEVMRPPLLPDVAAIGASLTDSLKQTIVLNKHLSGGEWWGELSKRLAEKELRRYVAHNLVDEEEQARQIKQIRAEVLDQLLAYCEIEFENASNQTSKKRWRIRVNVIKDLL